MSFLYCDFETRSQVDLKKVGVYAYAHHPSTEIACTGWAVDDAEAEVVPGYPDTLIALLGHHILVSHNAQMEREMIHAQLGVLIPWDRIVDTAALSARMSLPRKLEAVAVALKLDQQKDMTGHRIMLKLARPKGGWDDDEFWEEEEKPADFAALREYCRQDVVVMREIHRRLLPLSAKEAKLYGLTGKMNDRGVRVDLESIPEALDILNRHTAIGDLEFRKLTGGHGVKSYKNVAKALGLPNVKKVTIRHALRNGYVAKPKFLPHLGDDAPVPHSYERIPLTATQRRALELFQKLAKSSPAKLTAMVNRANKDGRVRGVLIYSGAERTQRWSSGGIQVHNFPRGLGKKTDLAFAALRSGAFELLYDNPVDTISQLLRGFLLGPMLVGDFAQIEARTLNWFAGQEDILDIFRAKGDVYCHTASAIYGRTITKQSIDPKLPTGIDPRFVGKVTELGAGYGLGYQKFQRQLDEVYDVQIDAEFAMRIINTYRATHQRVCAWWRRLEQGFTYVVQRNQARLQVDPKIAMGNVEVGGLRYAYIELPNGRRLYYAEPEMTADGVRYWGRNIYAGGKWDRVSTYGGKLAENIVQAFSRDVMAEAMIRLDDKGYALLKTVHDEIVAEDTAPEDAALLSDYHDTMVVTPSWATGLPIEVEVFRSQRYRK
jgi:DNA polymerase bacteriophage-type